MTDFRFIQDYVAENGGKATVTLRHRKQKSMSEGNSLELYLGNRVKMDADFEVVSIHITVPPQPVMESIESTPLAEEAKSFEGYDDEGGD